MIRYSVRAFTGTTAATADVTIAALWNASTTKRICVVEVGMFCSASPGAQSWYIERTTTKGTAGATVTPDIDNCWDADVAPVSATVLDTVHSSQPTGATPPLWGFHPAAATGAGFIWQCPRGIWLPQSTGLGISQRAAVAGVASEVYFVWDE